MKHLLALPAVLRTVALLASASQHSFSVQDDILAFPQYQLNFSDDLITEEQARVKLATSGRVEELKEPQYQLEHRLQKGDAGSPIRGETESADYEKLTSGGYEYLCRVPRIKKRDNAPAVNETVSKAEEEKELARASNRGWELLSGMQDNCIYFIGGWWSYQFCYNEGVRQFHQLPPTRGVPMYPPQEDPGVPGFMLGMYSSKVADVDDDHEEDTKWDGGSSLDKSGDAKRLRGGSGELVQRGESRYLTQTLGGGTRCDLTGKHRKIEVQYHCNPQGGEHISLIKEMATCTYLMVIQTPRLCNDVAFQPPQKDQPNTISCQRILFDDFVDEENEDYKVELATYKKERERLQDQEAAAGKPDGSKSAIRVGDIFVGMHRLVPEGKEIEKSAIVGGGKEVYVDTLASSDGKTITKDDLKRLGLGDAKAIEKLKEQIERIAQGEQWKLDVVDTARGREYRGVVGSDDEETEPDKKAKETGPSNVKDGDQKNTQKPKQKDKEQSNGSEEEYYKEEL